MALFVERARAVLPDFPLDEANAAAMAGICTRLDGLPLAIDLAAARLRLLAPATMLQHLSETEGRSPLELLGAGPDDLPDRQRTLRNTIAWSHNLLAANEQPPFRRLAVFAGGFTAEAAAALAALDDGPPLDVFEGLATLIDASLLMVEPGAEAERRFRMLELVREFAWERLRASGEAVAARGRHRDWFLTYAEAAEPPLWGPHVAVWLPRLEREHPNLRAALQWSLEQGDTEAALRLCVALHRF